MNDYQNVIMKQNVDFSSKLVRLWVNL